MANNSPRARQLAQLQAISTAASATRSAVPGFPAGAQPIVQLDDGRAERARAHARQTLYTRRILAAAPAISPGEARIWASLHPARSIAEIAGLATGRPAHRSVRDMIQLATRLPATVVLDLLALAAANNAVDAPGLARLHQNLGTRPIADLVYLVNRLHHLPVTDLGFLLAVPPPRTVQNIVAVVNRSPPYRIPIEIADLIEKLPGIGVPNLALLLRLPQARSVRFLRRIVVTKPGHRSIAFMEGLSRLMPNVGLDNIVRLAGLPPARDADLQQLVNGRPSYVSIADLVRITAGLPARSPGDILELATLRQRGVPTIDIIALGGAPAHRSGSDLARLATALAPRPMADIRTIASIAAVAGMGPNVILDFVADVAGFGLTAAQIRDAAPLSALLNVPGTHPIIRNILNTAHLVAGLPSVLTVLQGAANIQPAPLIACLQRQAANLPALVTHIADLNTAAGLLNNQMQFNRILANDGLIARGDDVHTVIAGAANMRIPALIDCMLRAPANLGHLVTHVADLDNCAALLADDQLITGMLNKNHMVANGNRVHAVLSNVPNLPIVPVLDLIRSNLNNLNRMNTFKADVDRALTGEVNVTGQRLLNVLDHIQNIGVAAPLGPVGDPALREAQNFGAATRNVMNNRISLAANAAYLANLRAAVDTLTGVVWGYRGGDFGRTGWNHNFGGPIYVPVQVNGFTLSNHVIAHLLNPQDAAHQVTTSNIRTATGNFAGTVIDQRNGGYRDHYLGSGMTMVCGYGQTHVITIFFN